MKKKTKKSAQTEQSLFTELGPALSEFLRRVGPPEEARRHFESARIEFLKGLRAILDKRIEQCSSRGAKGQKINVE